MHVISERYEFVEGCSHKARMQHDPTRTAARYIYSS